MSNESIEKSLAPKGRKKKNQTNLVDSPLNVSCEATSCRGSSEEQLSVHRQLPAALHSISRRQKRTSRI